MLALRSNLVVDAADEAGGLAAAETAADAVTFDLAAPLTHADREAARALVAQHIPAVALARRTVMVRVGDTRSGELEADLDATAGKHLAAVVLPGVEVAQDARDADVLIRKREMRAKVRPGTIRLIAEVDSAAGLRALPAILDAVDRHSAVALHIDGLRADLRLGDRAEAIHDHAMADVALATRAAGLPWLLSGFDSARGSGTVATRAHDFGASGVFVRRESEVRGMNALFEPDALELETARAMLAEWERLRDEGQWVGVVEGRHGPRLVDRRTVRAARDIVAIADVLERRTRGR
ncbi:MAG: hypothetical protein GEU80_03040 [Dehalococcoidia bacterium]|nr:hypothetical protein [Dehalococcoidia bacterium]